MNIKDQITEKQVVFDCLCLLNDLSIYSWRNNTGALRDKHGRLVHFGFAGSSDIIGIAPDGKFIAVECKRPSGGKVSELQQAFIDKINRMGGLGVIVRSAEELHAALKEAGYI